MHAPETSRRRWRWGRWLAIGAAGVFIATAVSAINLVTLTREAGALRSAVVTTPGLQSRLQVQASVGPALCALARVVLRFVPDVPPEAHTAVRAVRGASVAVYKLETAPTAQNRADSMESAAATMLRRGWNRAVAVQNDNESVVVFTRHDGGGRNSLRVSVVVFTEGELVFAEARLSPDELAALVDFVPWDWTEALSGAPPVDEI
jgi:hypothetical protein